MKRLPDGHQHQSGKEVKAKHTNPTEKKTGMLIRLFEDVKGKYYKKCMKIAGPLGTCNPFLALTLSKGQSGEDVRCQHTHFMTPKIYQMK